VEKKQNPPKVFISYSWSSPEHINRIVEWAERLVGDGVDVLLDKWDLKEGHDKYAYMEQMVTDPTVSKVLIFSDSLYAKKADERKGGVGTESQIISQETYEKVKQEKFIPIVLEYDATEKPSLPVFLANRIFLDFSTPERYYENYEKLLRLIFDKPLFKKPQVGKPPQLITEESRPSLITTPKFEAFKNAVLTDKSHFRGLASDYLDSVLSFLNDHRIVNPPTGIPLDEVMVNSINELLPIRDEFIRFLSFQIKYKNDSEIYESIFRFFESSLQFQEPRPNTTEWDSASSDSLAFLIYELFIYLIALLIKFKRFSESNLFIERPYLKSPKLGLGIDRLTNYLALYADCHSLQQRRKSKADLLRQRSTLKEVTFEQFMQADFVLCLRYILHFETGLFAWYPSSLIYVRFHPVPFEIFLRATSHAYFEDLKILLKVEDKEDLINKYKVGAKRYSVDSWELGFAFEGLMNIQKLDTQ
jgi:hypothetical protein